MFDLLAVFVWVVCALGLGVARAAAAWLPFAMCFVTVLGLLFMDTFV